MKLLSSSSAPASVLPALLATAFLALAPALPVQACGPGYAYPIFWLSRTPQDAEAFLDGDLGVLDAHLETIYLYIAYRHLTGLGFDSVSRANVVETWQRPVDKPKRSGGQLWVETVRTALGKRPAPRFHGFVDIPALDGKWRGYFSNCLDDAYRTAARTLQRRAEHYGADSPQTLEWFEAQEIVFQNCSGGAAAIPAELPPDRETLSRADRAYQIAAAHFYSRQYGRAAELFGTIAEDRASPWRDLAAYLIARCHIRSSSVGFEPREVAFPKALAALEAVLEDPARASLHEAAIGLGQYVGLRHDPEAAGAQIQERLLAEVGPTVRRDLIDLGWLQSRWSQEQLDAGTDFFQWLYVFRHHHRKEAWDFAARKALESKAPHWLAAALALVGSQSLLPKPLEYMKPRWLDAALTSDESEALRTVADEMPTDSPLYPTVAYHLAVVRSRSDPADALARVMTALEALDAPQAPGVSAGADGSAGAAGSDTTDAPATGLGSSDRNRFSSLAAIVAPDLRLRVAYGQLEPLATKSEDSRGEIPRAAIDPSWEHRLLLTDSAVNALNLASTDQLLRWLEDDVFDPSLVRRVAAAAWTRAVLFQDEATALALETLVAEALPVLASELESYRAAQSGEARRFAAAWTILRFPGLAPILRSGFGRHGVSPERGLGVRGYSYSRDNWWCYKGLVRPSFFAGLGADDAAKAKETLDRINSLEAAPSHLGNIILAWAEQHREDPRIPEALHRIVRASRSCGSGPISRTAFQTLHRRYPDSEWAKKTKYWYN